MVLPSSEQRKALWTLKYATYLAGSLPRCESNLPLRSPLATQENRTRPEKPRRVRSGKNQSREDAFRAIRHASVLVVLLTVGSHFLALQRRARWTQPWQWPIVEVFDSFKMSSCRGGSDSRR